MEKYRVELTSSAEKALKRLPREAIARIVVAMSGLATDPRPAGCRKLSGQEDTYRIRTGIYRIIYEIHEKKVIVSVLKIGHRKEIYR